MVSPRTAITGGGEVVGAAGEAFADTIGAMFDIDETHFIEQAEDSLTLGGNSYETGNTSVQAPAPEEPWDPFTGW